MLKKLLQRSYVLDQVLSIEEKSTEYEYCTLNDGSVYKNNPFYEFEENWIGIGLYIDE